MSTIPLPPDVPGRATSPAQRLEPDFRRWALLEDATYTWWHPLEDPEERRLYRLVVPESFDHDFASVPRLLWAFISPFDLGLASLFHDWLYRKGGRVDTLRWEPGDQAWSVVTDPWSRRHADELFARLMREQGVPKWRRRWAYRAVRVWGGDAWRGDGAYRSGMKGSLRVLTAAGGVLLLAGGVLLAVLGAGAGGLAVTVLAGITGAVLVCAGVTFLYASRSGSPRQSESPPRTESSPPPDAPRTE